MRLSLFFEKINVCFIFLDRTVYCCTDVLLIVNCCTDVLNCENTHNSQPITAQTASSIENLKFSNLSRQK